MEFATLAAGAGIALGIVESMQRESYRSRVLADFNELKVYILDIREKVNSLLDQNRAIISMLDSLPESIYRITDEVVQGHLLSERYVSMRARHTLFTSLPVREEVEISSLGFERFNDDLHYIFLKEHRISHILKIVPICELAIATLGEFYVPVIESLLDKKIEKLKTLFELLEQQIKQPFESLESNFDMDDYVEAHNLEGSNIDFEKISYKMHGPRSHTETVVVRRCKPGRDPCMRTIEICWNETEDRTTIDEPYNNRRRSIINDIEISLGILREKYPLYSNLKEIISTLNNYKDSLSYNNKKISNYTTTLVSFSAEELLEKGMEQNNDIYIKRISRSSDC